MSISTFQCQPNCNSEKLLDILFAEGHDPVPRWQVWCHNSEPDFKQSGIIELTPLLHQRLTACQYRDQYSSDLEDLYERTVSHVQNLINYAVPVAEELKRHGISVMLLKGMSLTDAYMGDIGLRTMADLDFLVRGDQVQKAMEILVDEGWLPNPAFTMKYLMQTFVPEYHSLEFRRGHIKFDMHWQPFQRRLGIYMDRELWQRSTYCKILNNELRIPCTEHTLLIAILHGVTPQVNRKVQWVCDIIHIVRNQEVNWDYFYYLVNSFQVGVIVNDRLGYVRSKYQPSIPLPVTTNRLMVNLAGLEYEQLMISSLQSNLKQMLANSMLRQLRVIKSRTAIGWFTDKIKSLIRLIRSAWDNTDDVISLFLYRRLNVSNGRQILQRRSKGLTCHAHGIDASNITELQFGSSGNGYRHLISGWSMPEADFVWSNRFFAVVHFSVPLTDATYLKVDIKLFPFMQQKSTRAKIDFIFNHGPVNRIEFLSEPFPEHAGFVLDYRDSETRHPECNLAMVMPDCARPEPNSSADDTRLLGVGLKTICCKALPLWDGSKPLNFTFDNQAIDYLECGWWMPEDEGVWSAMPHSTVAIPILPQRSFSSCVVDLKVTDLIASDDSVNISYSGAVSGTAKLVNQNDDTKQYFLDFAQNKIVPVGGILKLNFFCNLLVSPASVSNSTDRRKLGFKLMRISSVVSPS